MKDPSLVFNILMINFPKNLKVDYYNIQPNLLRQTSSERYSEVIAGLKTKKKRSEREQMILGGSGLPQENKPKKDIMNNGVANGDIGFWTPELLKRLNFFNYQRDKNNHGQDVYEESRRETQNYYDKRKMALEQLKKAMKSGN